ncbi:MAG TPA: class I SAM-dependent methyltransferase [Gemmatimonadaceae bacterium]|nr:class I SAM-dependent methyltransferase [Gemmatimonadaceae bacterium]
MIGLLKRLADNSNPASLAVRLRRRRFEFFVGLLETLPAPVRILDVGGTPLFWSTMPDSGRERLRITLVNLTRASVGGGHVESVVGDATDLSMFQAGEFDVVFSNSVIEHLGTFEAQVRMANEVRRVGRRYFIQTPNLYFPLEPHFLVPGFQFFPMRVRAWLVSRFNVGWYQRIPDVELARAEVESVRLLSRAGLRRLFPEALIYEERFGGMVKSFVAYHGWATRRS